MIDQTQLLLDRIATLEDRAIDHLGADVAEGARELEAVRRITWALAWLALARQTAKGDDALNLAKAHTHLSRALDLIKETVQ